MRNEALLKVLAGEMSNNMAYKLTMRSSMLIPPLDVLGPWSIEPPRVSRRLHLLRNWSHYAKTNEVFP